MGYRTMVIDRISVTNMSIKHRTLAITVLLLFLPVIAAYAQTSDSKTRIAESLLTTPDRCVEPCIWTFQPDVQIRSDFSQFAITLFPTVEQQALQVFYPGATADGVGLYAYIPNTDAIVQYIFVRLRPAVAQAAEIDITHFTPAAMIQTLGNPDEAYLLFNKANLTRINRFRLVMVYADRHAAYVMLGSFREGQACLVADNAETLTLYRFGEKHEAYFLESLLTSHSLNKELVLPPTIAITTNQTPADFTRMAQNPTTDCLTLK